MKTFEFAPGLNLRVIERDGKPWFVAKDACRMLELKGFASFHTQSLGADEVCVISRSKVSNLSDMGLFGAQASTASLVSESGLYSLILKSRKPEAKVFKKWVTSEVLPTIRKTGGYMAPSVAVLAEEDPQAFLARALLIAGETINGLKVRPRLEPPHCDARRHSLVCRG